MNNKTDFQKKILRSIAITVLILAIEAGILIFAVKVISQKTEEIKERKFLSLAFEQEKNNFENLEKDYQRIKPYLSTIEGSLPNSESLIRILEALENLGLRLNTRLSLTLETQTLLVSEIPGLNYVPFSAALEGNYDSLRNFLKELERTPIFVKIESINISGSSIFSGSNIQLKGRIYVK